MPAIFVVLLTLQTQVVAWVRVQSSLTSYQNYWDKELTFDAGQDRMLTGLYSYHDNGREDRRWRFWTGSVPGVQCVSKQWSTWKNNWDGELSFSCGSNQVLSGIWSKHDNGKEDRRWRFRCCEVSDNIELINIRKTHDLNDWDDILNFRCGSSEVLLGLESHHHNGYEDRLWKATCVALKESWDNDVVLAYRGLTNYVNGWDNYFQSTLETNRLFTGIASVHDNDKEDRRFRVHWAQLYDGLKCTNRRWSGYRNNWDQQLDYKCGGNSAISGLQSYHDNGKEDRRFNIQCCDLSNNGEWRISDIYKTGYVNEFDKQVNYRCGYMEVLVGLFSYHDNRFEDRRSKLYCGRLAPTDNFQAIERSSVNWSGYLNEMDNKLDFSTSDNKFIVGFQSYHSNNKEDRKWKVGTATLAGADCLPKTWSSNANDYDHGLDYLCPSNHALAGLQSEHSNTHEDRRWKFRCCDLSTSRMYNLRSPVAQPFANEWDGNLFEECPRDSVIVGACSQHDNGREDRRWQFYCSQVIKVSSYFAELSDLVVTSTCDVLDLEVIDEQEAFHTADNTHSSYPMEVELSRCFEKSFENQLQRSESTCSSETLAHTDSYTAAVSHEFSVTVSAEKTVLGVGASFEASYTHLLEQSTTREVTKETSEEHCAEDTEVQSVSTTLTDCKSCSVEVPAGGCSMLRKSVTFQEVVASCVEVHELRALNLDGSMATYAELEQFFNMVGMEASPFQAGSHALRYRTTTDIDVAYNSYSNCAQEGC